MYLFLHYFWITKSGLSQNTNLYLPNASYTPNTVTLYTTHF